MRVAVIDSGVLAGHPHIGRIAGGVSIGQTGDYTDRLGHGTAVMAAIQESAPEAEYFAVKVFHTSLRTTVEFLLQAIEWSLNEGMDIINLSLGTDNSRRSAEFAALSSRGALLIGAHGTYPGCLPLVAGVSVDPHLPRHTVRKADGVYYASGLPRPIPGVPPERNLQGISFAVANVTGYAVRHNIKTLEALNIALAP